MAMEPDEDNERDKTVKIVQRAISRHKRRETTELKRQYGFETIADIRRFIAFKERRIAEMPGQGKISKADWEWGMAFARRHTTFKDDYRSWPGLAKTCSPDSDPSTGSGW